MERVRPARNRQPRHAGARSASCPLRARRRCSPSKPIEQGPLYAFPVFGLLALAIAGVALGIARAAIDDVIELAGGKTPTLSSRRLAERPATQAGVARAEATLRAARELLYAEIERGWAEARQRRRGDRR